MSQLSRILELSGNPVAVLENVEESEDIAVKPGAVWNIPEDAKAYLLEFTARRRRATSISTISIFCTALCMMFRNRRGRLSAVMKLISPA